jgi:MoaA/NifB/PqqE/SkfB family radical SAM enzyme
LFQVVLEFIDLAVHQCYYEPIQEVITLYMSKLEKVTNPVRINVDTTRRCNLNCWYCHSTSGPEYKGPELSGTDIGNIFAAAETIQAFDVTLTGGETLMWKALKDAMAASLDLEFPSVQLITNGTLVDERRLAILQQGNLKRILVSLDGTKELHEANRGDFTYEKTLQGLDALRGVVDNVTVISVIDSSNWERWQDLTEILIQKGVKQHNLSPVCFSGKAMGKYDGLTREQFVAVREQVAALRPQLPPDFILEFNDELIGNPTSRRMPINEFTVKFKGWNLVVRPNGDVSMSVRAWGRSWRGNETVGNIANQPLTEIIAGAIPLTREMVLHRLPEDVEVRRKFHLDGITPEEIEADTHNVADAESTEVPLYVYNNDKFGDTATDEYDPIFTLPLPESIDTIVESLHRSPDRYRLRTEDGFGFLFNTETYTTTVLREDELMQITTGLQQLNRGESL